nr:MAG TPA_asm: hypothetical protein [Caudoviricetes sp.]
MGSFPTFMSIFWRQLWKKKTTKRKEEQNLTLRLLSVFRYAWLAM